MEYCEPWHSVPMEQWPSLTARIIVQPEYREHLGYGAAVGQPNKCHPAERLVLAREIRKLRNRLRGR